MLIILKIILLAASVMLAATVVPGIYVASFTTAVIVALVLGLINITLKPVLQLLSLPLSIATLGFFALIVNGLLFALAAYLVPGFEVVGFGAAFLGSIVVSVVNLLVGRIVK